MPLPSRQPNRRAFRLGAKASSAPPNHIRYVIVVTEAASRANEPFVNKLRKRIATTSS
jgi:hypothetical protein